MVKAEEPMRAVQDEKSVTPQEFVEAVASVPGKVGTHIKNEWADIKVYQANSWAEMKFRLQGLKEKFQAKKDQAGTGRANASTPFALSSQITKSD